MVASPGQRDFSVNDGANGTGYLYSLDISACSGASSNAEECLGNHHRLSIHPQEIPSAHRHKCVHLPENAIDLARFNQTAEQPGTLPLRACFIARMDPCKGTDMLVEAAAPLLKDGRMTLDMIGDGPMMPEVRALVDRLGIADAVTFHGWIDHKAVQDIAVKAHLLTFPSIREFGGGVVLEAMALASWPVVVDYGGPVNWLCLGQVLRWQSMSGLW